MRSVNLVVGGLFLFRLFAAVEGAELVFNNDFESGGLYGWHSYVASSSDKITPKTFSWGTDIYFLLTDGGLAIWDVQIWQGGLHVRPGYKYVLSFGGSGVGGARKMSVGVDHNGEPTSLGGDGSGVYTSYMTLTETLSDQKYVEFKTE